MQDFFNRRDRRPGGSHPHPGSKKGYRTRRRNKRPCKFEFGNFSPLIPFQYTKFSKNKEVSNEKVPGRG